MKKQLCSKMTKKPGMPEARPCMRNNGHSSHHTPDLTGLINTFGYKKILGRGPNYIDPQGKQQVRWKVLDKFGGIRSVLAHCLFSGNSTGKNAARKSGLGARTKDGKNRPEYATVCDHHYAIKKSYVNPAFKSYKNVPFYDGWNPDKGGTFMTGMLWIIENLEVRKPGDHLHIIDRKIGFMPGNLVWVPRSGHKQEEMINKLLLENSKLKKKLQRCE